MVNKQTSLIDGETLKNLKARSKSKNKKGIDNSSLTQQIPNLKSKFDSQVLIST